MEKQMKRKEGLLVKIMKGIKSISKRKLFKNKVYSILMMILGYLSINLLEGDGTVFIMSLILALPIFFARENVIL